MTEQRQFLPSEAIDLIAFAESIRDSDPALAGKIRHLRDAHSANTDLKLAYEFTLSMKLLREKAVSGSAGSLIENSFLALLYSVIVLYARATATGSDHRATFNFQSKMDDAEKKAHAMLLKLRNDAVAHFGPGDAYIGPAFQKEGVFVPYTESGEAKVMTASRRLVVSPGLLLRIEVQVHRAFMLATREVEERNTAVTKALNDLVANNPASISVLHQFGVELADFFGSADAVKDALAGPRIGNRRGTVRHA